MKISPAHIATTCFLILCFVVGVTICWHLSSTFAALGSDFVQDYVAGIHVRRGLSIYGEPVMQTAEQMLGLRGFENFHPPFLALPFAFLSFLPYAMAHLVLNCLSLLVYLGILVLLMRELQLTPMTQGVLLVLAPLWHPFIEVIALGQTSLIIAGLVIGAWFLLRAKHDSWAGACLALACLMKLFPGFMVVYLVMARRWRALFAWTATMVLGAVATLLFVGFTDVWRYVVEIAPRDAEFWSSFPANVSLRGSLLPLLQNARWSTPLFDLSQWAPTLVTGVQVLLLIFTLRATALLLQSGGASDQAYALCCIACVLCSPIAWSHNLVLMLLPLMLVWRERCDNKLAVTWLVALVMALFSLPTYEVIRSLQAEGTVKLSFGYFIFTRGGFVGLVLLFGRFCPARVAKSLRATPSETSL